MQINISTKQILLVLQIISWIIFIGLCIEAGGIIVNTFITLFINPDGVINYWENAEYLTLLYKFDSGDFFVITFIMIIISLLKVIMFFLILKLFTEKQIDFSQPFKSDLRKFISNLSYLAIGIGLFSNFGSDYSKWLSNQHFKVADIQTLNFAGADVWLFMAVILFVIGQIIKRGIEIQIENELTI